MAHLTAKGTHIDNAFLCSLQAHINWGNSSWDQHPLHHFHVTTTWDCSNVNDSSSGAGHRYRLNHHKHPLQAVFWLKTYHGHCRWLHVPACLLTVTSALINLLCLLNMRLGSTSQQLRSLSTGRRSLQVELPTDDYHCISCETDDVST